MKLFELLDVKLFELLDVAACDCVAIRDYDNKPLFYGYIENLMKDPKSCRYLEYRVLRFAPKTEFGGEKYLEINIW